MTVPFIDRPVAGHYQMRLARGGVFVAVRFWFGAPVFDGEVLDRSPRWCVEVNGQTTRPVYDDDGNDTGQRELLDPFEVWPVAGGRPISADEYAFLARLRSWAEQHNPAHPAAQPRRAIDVRNLKPGW